VNEIFMPREAHFVIVQTTRKPRARCKKCRPRSAERHVSVVTLTLPPLAILRLPVVGPVGSMTDPVAYSPYLSLTISAVLPCMSYKPHGLAFLTPHQSKRRHIRMAVQCISLPPSVIG
jgi:hypothetical protein